MEYGIVGLLVLIRAHSDKKVHRVLLRTTSDQDKSYEWTMIPSDFAAYWCDLLLTDLQNKRYSPLQLTYKPSVALQSLLY